MIICVLGRQPEIGIAELESLYGSESVRPAGQTCALVDADIDFARLGGSVKTATLLASISDNSRKAIFKTIAKLVPKIIASMPSEGKIKLGLSVYGFDISPYELGGEALRLKKIVRASGRSIRVVPNETPALSSAQTYHNKLADELGVEIVIVSAGNQVHIGRVTAVQDIDAYRIRDRERPKRDAFIGMLPPKLAQIIVNLAIGQWNIEDSKSQKSPIATSHIPIAKLKLPSRQPEFPMLALIVSGGHSQLVLFRDHGDYELLGQTQDDAVGEAFDNVAKMLGLPYPGGPSIAAAAEMGDPHAFALPTAKLSGKYDFSFSGLKTAVLRAVQKEIGVGYDFPSHELPERVSDALRANMSASFQYVAVKTLVTTTMKAFHDFSPASVVIAGGVAANQELRRQLQEALPILIEYAPMNLCTDNAAMIAALGYYRAQKLPPTDPYDVEVLPSISMSKTAWSH